MDSIQNYGLNYGWAWDSSYAGPQAYIIALLLVIFLIQSKLKEYLILRLLSKYSLSAYLLSWIYDQVVYEFVSGYSIETKMIYMPVIVASIISMSLLTGVFVTKFVDMILNQIPFCQIAPCYGEHGK